MTLPVFDTYAHIKRLRAAGFTTMQAETQTALHAEVLSMLITEKLATKDDLAQLRLEMKNDVAQLENKLENKINHLDVKFTEKFKLLYWMMTGVMAGTGSLIVAVGSLFFRGVVHAS